LADKVDDQLAEYRRDKNIETTWPSRERVVVALSGGPEGDTLIRRATRIAARSTADIKAVYIAGGHGLASAGHERNLARQRLLIDSIGGTFHQVIGDDIPQALLDFARGVNATQLVLGASRRGRWAQLWSRGVGTTVTARSGAIDVHLVTHEKVAAGRRRRRSARVTLSRQRRVAGYLATVVGLPLLALALAPLRDHLSVTSILLIMLSAVMGIALTGGMWPALLAAFSGFMLVNVFFIRPLHTFAISDRDHFLALSIFLLVGAVGATMVNVLAVRTRQAARAGAEAQTLATLAGSVLRGDDPLPALLEQVRETFGLTSVTLLERAQPAAGPGERLNPGDWRVVEAAGEPVRCPGVADGDIPIEEDLALALNGPTLAATDRRMVEAFAMQAAVALRQERLAARAAEVRPLAEADRLRTALLAAVSHDLRTP
ncbi:MAG: DUF4118 domain-containing protein, partial [Stackebrandtia sp.]